MGSRKKIRGLKRRIRKFSIEVSELTRDFPEDLSNGYWELHLPDQGSEWINSVKTPLNVRKQCLQILINRTKHLIEEKPTHYKNAKVMLMIDFHYWYATKIEIVIAENDEEFSFYKEDDYTRWIPLDGNRNFSKEWDLTIPVGLEVKGVKEEIKDVKMVDEDIYGGEIWFLGELN